MLKRRALMATLIGLGLLVVSGAVGARQKRTSEAAKTMTLTPLDYIEIRQLVSRYAFAADTGSNNGFDYADLFAADGELMRPYAKGREQLAALARGRRLGSMNTVHYIMNHVIAATHDGAVGKEYLIELNWDLSGGDQTGRGQGQGRVGNGGRGVGLSAEPNVCAVQAGSPERMGVRGGAIGGATKYEDTSSYGARFGDRAGAGCWGRLQVAKV